MSIDSVLQTALSDFEKALSHLNQEFGRLQVGQASPSLVEHLMIEAYGSHQPLKNVASVSVPDPRTLQIQPWDKSILGAVERAIQISDLHLNPINNGLAILLNIPQLTEERRKELVKVVHRLTEEARIAIRNSRQDALSRLKQLSQAKEITEDQLTGAEKRLQEKVDDYNGKVAELAKKKEESVMKV